MRTITPCILLECPKLYFKQVKEDQVKQMDIENSFITKWKDTQVSSNSQISKGKKYILKKKQKQKTFIVRKDNCYVYFQVSI